MTAARELDLATGPPPPAASGEKLARILLLVEELSASSPSGCLAFERDDGTVAGAVFVEDGRVCWAAATGLGRRLSDLLIARSNGALGRARVETLVAECRARGKPLGERLVELGLVDEATLMRVLLEHTTESLEALSSARATERWVARKGGYRAQFTFGLGELLACAERARAPFDARARDEHWSAVLSPEDPAVAFRGLPDALVPVATRGALFSGSVSAVLSAGALASSVGAALATFGQAGALMSGLTDSGSTYFAWCHGHLSSVAIAERGAPRTLSRILSLTRTER